MTSRSVDAERGPDRREHVGLGPHDEVGRTVTEGDRPGAELVEGTRVGDERVLADHRHHGVEVHEGSPDGKRHGDHGVDVAAAEEAAGDRLHRLRGGALAHADHHGTAADHQDVATFDRGAAPVLVDAAVHGPHVLGPEGRVEAVDRLEVRRLPPPSGHRHRVQGDVRVHPAGRVPGEEVVRERGEQEALRPADLQPQPTHGAGGELARGEATDQVAGCGGGVGGPQEVADGCCEVAAELELGHGAIEEPRAGSVVLDRLGEEVPDIEHLDALVAQRVREGVVLLASPTDPEHVVEEQLAAVGGREAPQLEVRAVQQHSAQRTHLGGDAVGGHGRIVRRHPVRP